MINLKRYKESLTVFLLGLGLLAGATACTDDNLKGGEESDFSDGIYLSVMVTQPSGQGTRTATAETMDTEIGRWYENEIVSLILVLANDDDKIITSTYISGSDYLQGVREVTYPSTNEEGNKFEGKVFDVYKATGKITKKEIEPYLGRQVKIYLICNPTPGIMGKVIPGQTVQQVIETASIAEIDFLGSKTVERDNTPKSNYQFLMTNADYTSIPSGSDKYKITIPEDILNGQHSTPETAYPLTAEESPLPVQRALARFDLDDSVSEFYFSKEGEVLGSDLQDSQRGVTNWVSLEFFGLINESRTLNLFKETGNNTTKGTKGTDWNYFWPEYKAGADDYTRFVYDPKYSEKLTYINSNMSEDEDSNPYFHNHLLEKNLFTSLENYDHTVTDEGSQSGTRFVPGELFTTFKADGVGGYSYNAVKDASGNYFIRRYCTPNTIHGKEKQKNGISTGAAFIARINFGGGLGDGTLNESQVAESYQSNTNEFHETPIYAWKNVFYGVNSRLQGESTSDKERAMGAAYNAAVLSRQQELVGFKEEEIDKEEFNEYILTDGSYDFRNIDDTEKRAKFELYNDYLWLNAKAYIDDVNKEYKDESIEKCRLRYARYRILPSLQLAQSLVEHGFSIYIPTDPQGDNNYEYMCYYIYWNQHNNNGNNEVMGNMEFAVVRNNIYKLKVTAIKKYGHPLPRHNYPEYPVDPDPITPGTDDETVDNYIAIDCKVLNWVVRKDDDVILY